MVKFTDKNVQSYSGIKAEELIAKKNDMKFLSKNGVIQVDHDRWKEAQFYEKKTWMKINRNSVSDRNEFIFSIFDYYSFLRGYYKNVCEIGCGPFTNLRLILPKISTDRVVLVDPLINDYLKHPNCNYKNRKLDGKQVEIIKSKAEDFQYPEKFDLVIMINVLPHCMNALRIFDMLFEIMTLGGTIIFHEVAFNMDVVKNNKLYDAGHPLLVNSDLLNGFMSRFKEIYCKRMGSTAEYLDECIYFVGTKEFE